MRSLRQYMTSHENGARIFGWNSIGRQVQTWIRSSESFQNWFNMKDSVVWLLTLRTMSIGTTLSHKVTRMHTIVIGFHSRYLLVMHESLELWTSEQSMFLCLAQRTIWDILSVGCKGSDVLVSSFAQMRINMRRCLLVSLLKLAYEV